MSTVQARRLLPYPWIGVNEQSPESALGSSYFVVNNSRNDRKSVTLPCFLV